MTKIAESSFISQEKSLTMNPVVYFPLGLAGLSALIFLLEMRDRRDRGFLLASGGVAVICVFFALKIQFGF